MYPRVSDDDTETKKPVRSFSGLLQQHISEAMANGFDDSIAKFKGKSQFVVPTVRTWFDTFDQLHAIFTGNWDTKAFGDDSLKIEEYQAYHQTFLTNFQKYLDFDRRFFNECCEYGLELAFEHYMDMLPSNYSHEFHEQKMHQAVQVLDKYARVASIAESYRLRLKGALDDVWHNGRQQCGTLSLRCNPCVQAKHADDADQHSSGVVLVSTCNCGRIQGRRDDPYSVREANYDFYRMLAGNCPTCNKLTSIQFAVFEPSICDPRAAELDHPVEVEPVAYEDDISSLMNMVRKTDIQSSSVAEKVSCK